MKVSGKELKLALKMGELTQEIAAKRLGISRQTLNAWLKNDEISEDILHKVKRVLDIDLITTNDAKNSDNIDYNTIVTQEIKPLGNNKNGDIQEFSFNDARMVNQRANDPKSQYPQKPPHELIQIIQNMQSLNTIQGQQIESLRKQVEKILMNI